MSAPEAVREFDGDERADRLATLLADFDAIFDRASK
jgi:hypothetical protein